MLDIANDIRSLSDFKRNTSELLERLKKTGNPLVLTINGKAELVVQVRKPTRSFWNASRRLRAFSEASLT